MKFTTLLCMIITSTLPALASNPKIVVVGAGLAGLTTAYRLNEQGFDVEVYEARKRVGGRVFSVILQDEIGELGGQNIFDGGEAKNVKKLIKDVGLSTKEKSTLYHLQYFLNRQLISEKKLLADKHYTAEHLQQVLAHAAENSKNMKEVFDKILDPLDPLYTALAVRLSAYEGGEIEKLSSVYVETLYHILLGGISAAHRAPEGKEMEIQSCYVQGGNSRLPEKIAQELGSVHTNMPLKAVKKKEGKYQLHFANGVKVCADILVLAVPCTVYEDIEFEQGIIPEEKLESIKAIQYGTNAKILIPLSTPQPVRFACLNEKSICFNHTGSTTMTIYFTGESSLFSSDTIQQRYLSSVPMLETTTQEPQLYSLSAITAEDRAFIHYKAAVGHSWPVDPYAKGSYSYIAPGQEKSFTETLEIGSDIVKTLFAPIDDTLYFAGEHTSTLFDVPGTMEAACESGEKTARLINFHFKSLKQASR